MNIIAIYNILYRANFCFPLPVTTCTFQSNLTAAVRHFSLVAGAFFGAALVSVRQDLQSSAAAASRASAAAASVSVLRCRSNRIQAGSNRIDRRRHFVILDRVTGFLLVVIGRRRRLPGSRAVGHCRRLLPRVGIESPGAGFIWLDLKLIGSLGPSARLAWSLGSVRLAPSLRLASSPQLLLVVKF
jgi:hypothetical protein